MSNGAAAAHLDAAVAQEAEGVNGLNDLRVNGKIEAENSLRTRREFSPEFSGRNQGGRGGVAAAAVLAVRARRDVRGREEAVEDVCCDVGQGAWRGAS